jgi:hypothetical protein
VIPFITRDDMGVARTTFRVVQVLRCREAPRVGATITSHPRRPSVAEGVKGDKRQPVGRRLPTGWPALQSPVGVGVFGRCPGLNSGC